MDNGLNKQKQLVEDLVRDTQNQIDTALPPGAVVPRHTGAGHFYGVPSGGVYPSVTGVLGAFKDPSIQAFDMNEALRYVEANIPNTVKDGKFDLLAVADMLYKAKTASRGIFMDAADIGTQIHDRREEYYQDWIDAGVWNRPAIGDYYDLDKDDVRLISAIRALGTFCDEHQYIPIRCEMLVYSDKYKLAGTLDDLGMVNTIIRKGEKNCTHKMIHEGLNSRCFNCDHKRVWQLALTDLKSSNQFKDSYFLQVAIYQMMFVQLTGIKPKRNFILKTNKEGGKYQLEELKKMPSLISAAKHVIMASGAIAKVKRIRKESNTKPTIKI